MADYNSAYTGAQIDAAVGAVANKADDNAVVHDTGNETIGGVKTFSSFPVTPSTTPSTDYQAANKKYIDDKVKTNVPANAEFTDTVTTINGKTGAIEKADITALGIPAQDTVYTHPTTAGNKHIPTGGASGQVLKYSASGTAVWGTDNNTITTVNGKTGAISKADIVALGIPAQDTVYTHPTTAGNKHIPTGGATNQILKYSASGTAVWGAESVTPVVDNLTSTDTDKALSANQGKVLNDLVNTKMPIKGGILENYREKLVTLSGTSTAIDLSLGNVFTHSLTGNTTYSITNAVNGQAHSFTLIINQDSTVRILTFPVSVKWQGGEIPDMTTASKTYVLTFVTVDGGTTWLGMSGGEF